MTNNRFHLTNGQRRRPSLYGFLPHPGHSSTIRLHPDARNGAQLHPGHFTNIRLHPGARNGARSHPGISSQLQRALISTSVILLFFLSFCATTSNDCVSQLHTGSSSPEPRTYESHKEKLNFKEPPGDAHCAEYRNLHEKMTPSPKNVSASFSSSTASSSSSSSSSDPIPDPVTASSSSSSSPLRHYAFITSSSFVVTALDRAREDDNIITRVHVDFGTALDAVLRPR